MNLSLNPHTSVELHCFLYDEAACDETFLSLSQFLLFFQERQKRTLWCDFNRERLEDWIQQTAMPLQWHWLLLKNLREITPRPQMAEIEGSLLFQVTMISGVSGDLKEEIIQLIVHPEYLVSIQEKPGDVFESVRERLRQKTGQIRRKKADYLLYRLLGAVLQSYVHFLESFEERLEELENRLLRYVEEKILLDLSDMKRDLMKIRRACLPLKESILAILNDEPEAIAKNNLKYFRDLSHQASRVVEMIENQGTLTNHLMDLFVSQSARRTSDVMRVLTVVSTVFIPLTFIVGVYGMNFRVMPELTWRWGYPAVWLFMLAFAGGTVFYLKKKKWW